MGTVQALVERVLRIAGTPLGDVPTGRGSEPLKRVLWVSIPLGSPVVADVLRQGLEVLDLVVVHEL